MLLDLLAPLSFPLEPEKRIFWISLLSSLILASIATSVYGKRFDIRSQLAALFDRRYWINSSTLVDVALMFVNNAIRVLVLLPALGSRLVAVLVVGRFFQSQFGDSPSVPLPWFAIASLFSISLFLAEDASRYFLHYAMHRIPFLWRFHRWHHTATVLTPLTLFRVHPLEHIAYFIRGVVVFGVVSGFFVWMFGRDLGTFDILGVGVLGFLFNLAGANLRHSPIWLSFGHFEKWFISPAQHQLHHSKHHGHVNLGSALAVWDRIMGTGQYAKERTDLEFGVTDPPTFRIASVASR